jgi:ferredoxin
MTEGSERKWKMIDFILIKNAAACVDCTACVGRCPAGALQVERPGYVVSFDDEACTACGRCVDACGYGALELARCVERKRGAA